MSEFRDFLIWLSDHAETLATLFFGAVVAWTAWEGMKLNRRLVDGELDPAITVFLEPNPLHWHFIELVIRNAGRGAARNVQFQVDPDIPVEVDDEESKLTRIALFRRGVPYMGPGQEIRTFFASYNSAIKEPITIHVSCYGDLEGRHSKCLESNFLIDVTQFEGLSKVGDPPELSTMKALNKIADDLHAIRMGGSWWSPTITVRRRYFASATINRRWRRLSERWRNFGIRRTNGDDSWRLQFKRLLRR